MHWTGIGALGAFVIGVTVLGEAVNLLRIGGVSLVVTGLVLMKVSDA